MKNSAATGLRILVLFVVQVIVIQACRPSEVVYCQVGELLLDETTFPEETVVGELESPLPDGTKHSAGRTYYLGKGIANHLVYGFSSSRRAKDEFQQQQKDPAFSSATPQWQTPDEMSGLLTSATQHQVVCGTQHQIPMCKVIAQYDNYFIFFNIHMYPEETTIADLSSLLQEIDDRMAYCLSSTPVAQDN